LDLLIKTQIADGCELVALRQERAELRAIFVASLTTAKRNTKR
jgi:hypothetical protein